MNTEAVNQEYQTVNLSQLTESLTNPRKTFEYKALNEMAESIRAVGLLQPILVRPTATEGRFEIVAGARRFRAARLAESNPYVFESANSPMPRRLRLSSSRTLSRPTFTPTRKHRAFLR